VAVGTGFAQRWQDFDPRQCQAEDVLQVEIIEKLIITADVPTDCSGRTAPTPCCAQTIARWVLDQPVWVQYLTYLVRIPNGNR
jgi:hypothetical protein